MDIGEIIKAPTQDKDWIKKCLLMGVFMLIPVVGMLNLMGYLKACYEAHKASGPLPEAGLNYIGDGWWLFVAMLPAMGLMFVLMILVGILGAVGAQIHRSLASIVALGGNLIVMLIGLAFWVLMPAVFYLHIVKGERWASLKIGQMIGLVKANSNSYLMFWLLILIAGFIGGLGQLACGLGMLFTLPFSYAIQGAALAEFEKKVG